MESNLTSPLTRSSLFHLLDCSATRFEDSKCTPVEGRMSMYFPQPGIKSLLLLRSSLTGDETPSLIIDMLKEGMDNDKFLDAHR